MSNLSMKGSITIEEEEDEDKVESSTCVDKISRFIPILEWFPRYTHLDAVSDLIAGITLGLTMIPQSIAYAALAGVSAQYGLYSAFAGSLIYIFFGKIKEVSIGPTSLMSLLTNEYTRGLPIDFVFLLGFLSGCMELLFGLLNFGFLVDFISTPVTSGFTSATSVIIILGQLERLLGLEYKTSSNVEKIFKAFQHIGDIRIGDTLIGVSSIIFLLTFRRLNNVNLRCRLSEKKQRFVKKLLWFLSIGRNALLILITTIIAFIMERAGKSPFVLSGKVEPGLPSFGLPSFSTQNGNQTYSFVEMCSQLGSGIFIIPLVAVLANVSIAKVFASDKGVDAAQEMRSLGLCNIFGSFVQSMPTCGAFSRSAVSNSSGVRTPLSGLYAGVLTLLALSFLTPYFYYIPRASLAAVLIGAVIFMIEWSIIPILWKGNKKDMAATITTFVACIISVEYGLLFGVTLNILYLLHAWARPNIEISKCKTADGDKYILIKPDIGLYYPAVDFLRNNANQAAVKEGKNILPIVLDCDGFKSIDYTGMKCIEAMINEFEKKGQCLMFIRLNAKVFKKIESLGGIKILRHAKNEEDIVGKLFYNTVEMTRSATVPIFEQTKSETADNNTIGITQAGRDTADNREEEHEGKPLVSDYQAVIKEFETSEKSKLQTKPPES
ncbi:sodium-independent sulfate anion transporter isoform X2 [Neodiprion pinetum]|uniref:sodium-independent sulfate anion transporter isoform X2 n=1 Tax=Neodiprion pinetum TaxID=441929 RepID=UPI001EDEB70F|nr:sodium-independent sulfate anion transporter-like isoform X2 [Neodiprion pinetum]